MWVRRNVINELQPTESWGTQTVTESLCHEFVIQNNESALYKSLFKLH